MIVPHPQSIRPIFRQSILEFEGPDPWNYGQTVHWLVVIYQITRIGRVERFELSAENRLADLPAGYVLGLFARETNQYHLLPYSLRRLWQQGHVSAEVLPQVLYRSEQQGVVDHELVSTANYLRVPAVVMLTLGLVVLLAAPVIWLLSGRLEASIMCGILGLFMALMSTASYLQYWLWKRRQNKFTQHWMFLARES